MQDAAQDSRRQGVKIRPILRHEMYVHQRGRVARVPLAGSIAVRAVFARNCGGRR